MLRIGIDVGGTFTDLVAYETATGRFYDHKVLTTPLHPTDGILRGLRELLARAGLSPDALRDADVLHGTTLVANALIERTGRATALLVTPGTRDVLETGRENRYDPYDRMLRRPAPLVERRRRREVPGRLRAGGAEHEALDREQVAVILKELAAEGVEAVAVCFLHSYAHPVHERAVREIAQSLGLRLYLSLSCDVAPEIGEHERVTTTAANAYIQPIVEGYLRTLREALESAGHRGRFYLMWSDGGLASVDATLRVPIRLLESGPAAGALAACHFGARHGLERVIASDMGGTTAKICLIRGGEPDRAPSFEIGRVHRDKPGSGLPVRVPTIHMLEIGAGGGSLARMDDMGLLKVGPESAGARPGPACYGLGGAEPTVTDASLVLGYLPEDGMLADSLRLDGARGREAFRSLAERLGKTVEEVAVGVRRIVTEHMAQAVKLHVTERGEDPRDYTLTAFGGAAPLHACDVAARLGIRRVVIPAQAGVLSAFGFLAARVGLELVQTLIVPLDEMDPGALREAGASLRARAVDALRSAGIDEKGGHFHFILDMRYRGQGYEIHVPVGADVPLDPAQIEAAFTAAYRRQYGVAHTGMPEIRAVRLRAEGPEPALVTSLKHRDTIGEAGRVAPSPQPSPAAGEGGRHPPHPDPLPGRERGESTRRVWFEEINGWAAARVYRLADLEAGGRYAGPLLAEGPHTTIVVGPGGVLTLSPSGDAVVEVPARQRSTVAAAGARVDPVDLEIILARLRAMADEADRALLRTAFSSVVRDGKDYSLVITDPAGRCLALPTECMPLFVTSMPRTIGLLLERFPAQTLRPGDLILTNDPWMCAGHKSDLVLVAPFFHQGEVVAFIGTILHVPDIGGVLGDFRAWDIYEEGLALPPLKLYEEGRPNEAVLRILAENVRVPEHVLGDLAAMRAAVEVASRRMQEFLQDAAALDLHAVSEEVSRRAKDAFMERLRALPPGVYRAAVDADGVVEGTPEARTPIHLEATVEVGSAGLTINFEGSQRQRPRQAINVPIPYTIADTIYALQYMLAPSLPNVGPQFSPVRIV
ncbi:MAG: hydantoinase B/oxoprolinase family protein, partial [Armatimonadetes bacterium]|nr:hydantoinase B/oxoprolinase family protein [Armatimonadota bacterium]